ncbi:hypothetical protein DBR17_07070 [Sphingomonas sp. HMWF008]|nr:hypothetical protein DBR17_07070 [Sphingomonas sp. HMWF008]
MSVMGTIVREASDWRDRVRSTGDDVLAWIRARMPRHRVPVIFQSETTECSIACLAMIASYHGNILTVADLRARYPISLRGLTLRSVVEIAADLGLRARPVRCEPADLRMLRVPAMLHWDLEHFVVLTGIRGDRFRINDPGRGTRTVSSAELGRHFTGIAVEFDRTVTFTPQPGGERLTLRRLTGRVAGMRKAFFAVLALSLVLECLLLVQPMLLRYIIDLGFMGNDGALVSYLCVTGGVAALCAGGVAYARDLATLVAGSTLNLRMAHGLFSHSLSLPIAFYEKRLTGDLVDRYRSIENIERFMVGELPIAVLDGVFTLVSLLLLFAVSPTIALLTLAVFGVFALHRAMGMGQLRDAEEAVVSSRGHESGYLFESIQGILSIKVRAGERDRQGSWLSRFVELLNAQRRLAMLQARQRSVKVLLGGVDIALFAAVAYTQFHSQQLTFGALLAILFYKTHFFARSTALAERTANLRMLRIHLDRLEDIVHAVPERLDPPAATASVPDLRSAPATLAFEAVDFRYTAFDPWILRGASFKIEPGEFVALTGPSGCGKTTILKLLLGLYPPENGTIKIGGLPIDALPLAEVRRSFGVVMQDDQVLIGTIAQNVAFFDADIDMDRVAWCCMQACIHDDINALPMGYSTRIGGNAAGLSGGQRQRVLLARALYREAKFLLLDEGTANLDHARESAVIENLRKLSLTTLLIAHGDRPLASADRIIRLQDHKI